MAYIWRVEGVTGFDRMKNVNVKEPLRQEEVMEDVKRKQRL